MQHTLPPSVQPPLVQSHAILTSSFPPKAHQRFTDAAPSSAPAAPALALLLLYLAAAGLLLALGRSRCGSCSRDAPTCGRASLRIRHADAGGARAKLLRSLNAQQAAAQPAAGQQPDNSQAKTVAPRM